MRDLHEGRRQVTEAGRTGETPMGICSGPPRPPGLKTPGVDRAARRRPHAVLTLGLALSLVAPTLPAGQAQTKGGKPKAAASTAGGAAKKPARKPGAGPAKVAPGKNEVDAATEAVTTQKKQAIEELSRLAAAAESSGDLPGAIEAALKQRRIEPEKVNHLSRLLSLYQRAGMARKRIEVYRDVLKLKPKNVTYSVGLASALYRIGDKEEAHELWSSLLVGEDVPVATYRSVGTAYRSEKLYEQALAVFAEGLKHYEDDYSLLYGKGLALEMLGRNEQAIAAYEQARLKTKNTRSIDAKLNRLYVVVGVRGSALQQKRGAADAAIEKLAELGKSLGDTLVGQGRTAEAVAAYSEALGLTASKELRASLEASLAALRQKGTER